MQTWRESGCVPDSEGEDDDELDSHHIGSTIQKPIRRKPKIGDESTGPKVSEASATHQGTAQQSHRGHAATEPHPTSQFEGTATFSETQLTEQTERTGNGFSVVIPARAEAGPFTLASDTRPAAVTIEREEEDEDLLNYRRSLRQRKPIQLNPYLIEQEKYKQTLRSRGLKPIRIQDIENDSAANVSMEIDSSQEEYHESYRSDDNSKTTPASKSQTVDVQSSAQSPPHTVTMQRRVSEDSDFPDIQSFLRPGREVRRTPTGGYKRRKTSHVEQTSALIEAKQPPTSRIARTFTFSDSSDSTDEETPKKTVPNGHDDTGGHNKESRLQTSRSKPPDGNTGGIEVPKLEYLTSGSESDSESNEDITWLQRKTNGVLPASWWKLNLQGDTIIDKSRRNRKKGLDSRSDLQGKPGVARIKLKNRRGSASSLILADSDSSSSESVQFIRETKLQQLARTARPKQTKILDYGFVEEEEQVDAMLQRGHTRINKKKAKRTTKTHPGEVARRESRGTFSRAKLFESATKTHSRAEKPTPSNTLAISRTDRSYASKPTFLKIARRTAAHRGDRVRPEQGREGGRTHRPYAPAIDDKKVLLHSAPERRIPTHTTGESGNEVRSIYEFEEQQEQDEKSAPQKDIKVNRWRSIKYFAAFEQPHQEALTKGLQMTTSSFIPGALIPFGHKTARRQSRKDVAPRKLLYEKQFQSAGSDSTPYEGKPAKNAGDPVKDTSDEALGLSVLKLLKLDFEYRPVDPYIDFSPDSFIGSGGLERAIHTKAARFCEDSCFVDVIFRGRRFEWGVYSETCGADFDYATREIGEMLSNEESRISYSDISSVEEFLRFSSGYLSGALCFNDPVDVPLFAQRWSRAILTLLDHTESLHFSLQADNRKRRRLCIIISMYAATISYQIGAVCSKCEAATNLLSRSLLNRSTQTLFQCCLNGQDVLRHLYESVGSEELRGADPDALALLQAYVCLYRLCSFGGARHAHILDFWQMFNNQHGLSGLSEGLDLVKMEMFWESLFLVLPLQRLASKIVGERRSSEDWEAVILLSKQAMQVYETRYAGYANDYLRTVLRRIFSLITVWKWNNPQRIILELFKFFSRTGLMDLDNEYNDGGFFSFRDGEVSSPNSNDTCFHIFLKALIATIETLRGLLPERDVRDFVHRLIPNHGRVHLKSNPLEIKYLISLRNHYELLTALYRAAPPDCRPPVGAIRDLIDARIAHREACEVSLDAWFNLIQFQIAHDSSAVFVEPLMDWYNTLLEQTLSEHFAVKSQATAESDELQRKGTTVPTELLAENIRKNQRSLEAVIIKGIKLLEQAIDSAPYDPTALRQLLSKKVTADLFDASSKMNSKVLLNSISLLSKYLLHLKQSYELQSTGSVTRDESQDYGDWSGLDEFITDDDGRVCKVAKYPLEIFHSYHRMLSNAFGSDDRPEESFLISLVETWSEIAALQVSSNERTWDDFIADYGTIAWSSLRSTLHSRQFSIYFMAKIIELSPRAYEANPEIFIREWVRSLVEREAILKYQNYYTQKILLVDPNNPLFKSLPWTPPRLNNGLSLVEFKLRRLDLISAFLCNIRNICAAVGARGHDQLCTIDCVYYVQVLMDTMRKNYEDLALGKHSNSSYTKFLQEVVGLLQQYTGDVIPVERYFTDSADFPLPERDPAYLQGKLKQYCLTLANKKMELISFTVSLIERALVDNSVANICNQIAMAILECNRLGDFNLCNFFLQVILPGFVEGAQRRLSNWSAALPIFQITATLMESLSKNYSQCFDIPHDNFKICALSIWKVLQTEPFVSAETGIQVDVFLGAIAEILVYLNRFLEQGALEDQALVHVVEYAVRCVLQQAKGDRISMIDLPTATFLGQETRLIEKCADEVDLRLRDWHRMGNVWEIRRGNSTKVVDVSHWTLSKRTTLGIATALQNITYCSLENLSTLGDLEFPGGRFKQKPRFNDVGDYSQSNWH